MASKPVPPTPLLSDKHNGIPTRLFEKAQETKSAILNIATKPESDRTKVALPQGINQTTFRTAIAELCDRLGDEYVEFVTKLDDGWYDPFQCQVAYNQSYLCEDYGILN